MSGNFDDHYVHKWLAEAVAKAHVSLHYESPGMNGLGRGEISGGGYTRLRISFSIPINRSTWSMEDARWTGLTKTLLTHFGIWDDPYGGNLVAYGLLPERVGIANGQGYLIPTGQLALSIS